MKLFIYACINVLLLAAIVFLIGRKTIVNIFRKRRERINRELDELENPPEPEALPELEDDPERRAEAEAAAEAIAKIDAAADEEIKRLEHQTQRQLRDERRRAV